MSHQIIRFGPSGSGKTTLVDLLLGVLKPQAGEVLISGEAPERAMCLWPGAISYVPQEISIKNGSVRENVALGYGLSEIADEQIFLALEMASLHKFTSELVDGLDTQVGDKGTSLSGGQRQRLGIARAFFTNPKLLILDEATSSLDGDTEEQITSTISHLRGKATVILIAHRLSTVRNADCVLYINNGEIEMNYVINYQ